VLDLKTMAAVLKDDFSADEIRAALAELRTDFEGRGGVIRLLEVAEGFQLATCEVVAERMQKMDHYQHHRHLSKPALETLAIVAYRQPVTRQEIEGIRGVNVDRIVRNLVDKKLIRVMGRKDLPGKPLVYGTTREFLEYFGLKNLADLPTLEEFSDAEVQDESEDAPLLPLGEGDDGAAETLEAEEPQAGAADGDEEQADDRAQDD
jgi:segregation and condensation protein B